jgi:hypothetical protein
MCGVGGGRMGACLTTPQVHSLAVGMALAGPSAAAVSVVPEPVAEGTSTFGLVALTALATLFLSRVFSARL